MSKAIIDACTFVCTRCGREHIGQHARAIPLGWKYFKDGALRCPDCVAAAPFGHLPPTKPKGGLEAGQPIEPPISVHAARDGLRWLVALNPLRVTTQHQPLTFLIEPDQADALADELRRYAALARNPGTLGDRP
ncbi:MAG: hypothetical protein BGP16_12795 [Sphingobium sp. 66-54]|nr:MAG: hypothetical protein BGP16_12795 [Sphingobium sp. 66-54]